MRSGVTVRERSNGRLETISTTSSPRQRHSADATPFAWNDRAPRRKRRQTKASDSAEPTAAATAAPTCSAKNALPRGLPPATLGQERVHGKDELPRLARLVSRTRPSRTDADLVVSILLGQSHCFGPSVKSLVLGRRHMTGQWVQPAVVEPGDVLHDAHSTRSGWPETLASVLKLRRSSRPSIVRCVDRFPMIQWPGNGAGGAV